MAKGYRRVVASWHRILLRNSRECGRVGDAKSGRILLRIASSFRAASLRLESLLCAPRSAIPLATPSRLHGGSGGVWTSNPRPWQTMCRLPPLCGRTSVRGRRQEHNSRNPIRDQVPRSLPKTKGPHDPRKQAATEHQMPANATAVRIFITRTHPPIGKPCHLKRRLCVWIWFRWS